MQLDPPLDLHMNSNDDDDEEIEHQIGTFDTPSSSLFSPPPPLGVHVVTIIYNITDSLNTHHNCYMPIVMSNLIIIQEMMLLVCIHTNLLGKIKSSNDFSTR